MLWLIIMILVIAASVAGFVYLINRLSKLSFVQKLFGEKKKLSWSVSAAAVVAVCAVLWVTLGSINAIICLLHLVIFMLLCDIVGVIVKKLSKKKISTNILCAAAVIVTVGYLSAGWYLDNNVWEKDYEISTDKPVGNIRIVHFADSHVGTTFDGEGLFEYAKQMQALDPDVVLVTGDFVDDDTSKEDMRRACEALGSIKTKYGIYFSFGNHDKGYYGADYRGYSGDDLVAELEKNGVKVLEDETVLIDDRFYIVGRKDLSEVVEKGGTREDMQTLLSGLDKDKFTVVMDHQPCDYDAQSAAKADLVLSGHTHGGQLIPINLLGTIVSSNDRTYGYEKRDLTNFIVTSGISDWAIDFKTGCRSEFVVIDINGK